MTLGLASVTCTAGRYWDQWLTRVVIQVEADDPVTMVLDDVMSRPASGMALVTERH